MARDVSEAEVDAEFDKIIRHTRLILELGAMRKVASVTQIAGCLMAATALAKAHVDTGLPRDEAAEMLGSCLQSAMRDAGLTRPDA